MSATPRCSIVIPVFNRLELTRRCLETLALTVGPHVEVIVVDNGSRDGTTEFLATQACRTLSNAENQGFAKACNQGARAALSDKILFLNNDIEALPGWLDPLIHALDADPKRGAVGSRLLYPDGRLQHAGVESVEDRRKQHPLEFRHRFHGYLGNYPPAHVAGNVTALTGAAILVRREVFFDVGGFDEGYWNGYEDMALCLAIAAQGYTLYYEPASALIHLESASGPERWTKVLANIERMQSQWRGRITPDVVFNADGSRPDLPRPHAPAEEGLTSVILLAYNQYAFTRLAIESVLLAGGSFELLIIDNGSVDEGPEFYDELALRDKRVKVVHNFHNLGYGTGNNQGLAIAKGDMVVFLNNDTVVGRGWHERLRGHMEAHPEVGGVGPISNEVSGVQRIPRLPFPNEPESVPEMATFDAGFATYAAGKGFATHRLVGFCLMVRRSVIDQIGGFDPAYGIGNFEDDDLCLRVMECGLTLRVAQDVYVHHFGSTTFRVLKLPAGGPQGQAQYQRLKDKFGLKEVTGRAIDTLPWRHHPHLHYIELPEPQSPAWYPTGPLFTPDGEHFALNDRKATVFFHHPRWSGSLWQQVLCAYVRAFTLADPVMLVLWLDPSQGIDAQQIITGLEQVLAREGLNSTLAADLVLVPELLDRSQLNALYRAADVVVAPGTDAQRARAAASGRPVLEDLSPAAWQARASVKY